MAQGLNVVPKPNTGLFHIVASVGPGPTDLQGTFTSKREAKLAIDKYRRDNYKPVLTRNTKIRRNANKEKAKAKLEIAKRSKIVGESGEYKSG